MSTQPHEKKELFGFEPEPLLIRLIVGLIDKIAFNTNDIIAIIELRQEGEEENSFFFNRSTAYRTRFY
jgi:hypothetical protein